MDNRLTLYSYYRSSASYRVRIALNLKNLSYEYRPIHLLNDGGEQHKDEYKKLNPSGELPTLIHGDHVLSQSMAIILYLDDQFKVSPLFPKDSFLKAKTTQACEIINSGIQPLQNLRVLKHLASEYSFSDEQKSAWIQHWVHLGLTSFDKLIAEYSGKFCFGDSPSAADLFLVPQVFSSVRFGVSVEDYPRLKMIYDNCQALPAFAKADPAKQPDTPEG